MSERKFKVLLRILNERLLDADGVSPQKLDTPKRLKEYRKHDITKFSIEGNSNANNKNYLNRQSEIHKPYDKFLSYLMLWEKLCDLYGEEEANNVVKEAIEGSMLIHDLTNGAGIGIDFLYCTTISCKNILFHGRPYNKLESLQPQHLSSFVGCVIEYTIDASSVYAGAVTPSDLFVAMAYFTKNHSEEEIVQEFQRFVHIINNPYRPSAQSPFVNVSILTQTGLITAFGGYIYPDGSYAIDNIQEIMRIQEIFSKYYGKGIKQKNDMYITASFPVTTINIVRDNYADDREYIKKHIYNMNKFTNYNLYIGSSYKFASCCFDKDTMVSYKNNNGYKVDCSFIDLYQLKGDSILTTYNRTNEAKAKIVKIPFKGKQMYEITFSNGSSIKCTNDHEHMLVNGDKKTTELKIGDVLYSYNYYEFLITDIKLLKDYKEEYVYCFEMENQASPYFNLANGIVTHNCALINDFSKKNSINSFGIGSFGEQIIGSARVVTIDLYHTAIEAKEQGIDFFDNLNIKLDLGYKALYAQRLLAKEALEDGYNIFYNLGWIKLDDYWSSFGCGGLHEAVKTIFNGSLDEDYTDDEIEYAKRVPKFIEDYCESKTDDFMKLNLEFLTPLESGARRLGERIDIKYNTGKYTMISNRLLPTHIPVTVSRRLEIENIIGGSASAGGLCHLHIEGEVNPEVIMSIIDDIIDNYKDVELISFNKPQCYCKNNHITFEDTDTCKYCGEPIIRKINRSIGYFSDVSHFNESRKIEYSKRHWINP